MNVRTKLIGTIVVAAALLVPVAHAEYPPDYPVFPEAGDTPTLVVESTSSGFDWSSAAIGMAGGMGAALLLTGALFLLLGQRRRASTA